MLKLIGNLLNAVFPGALIPMPDTDDVRRRRILHQLAQRNAEGSVRLNAGRYATEEQIDSRFKTISRITFCS